jgi:hypothetical protein
LLHSAINPDANGSGAMDPAAADFGAINPGCQRHVLA